MLKNRQQLAMDYVPVYGKFDSVLVHNFLIRAKTVEQYNNRTILSK